jgi:hypothetical protein
MEQIIISTLKIVFDGFNDIKKIKKEEERVTLYKKED